MEDRTKSFMDFANGLLSGYIKPWKANSMLSTLDKIPEICEDDNRLNAYVKNCLLMEGFSRHHCDRIADYLLGDHIRTTMDKSDEA